MMIAKILPSLSMFSTIGCMGILGPREATLRSCFMNWPAVLRLQWMAGKRMAMAPMGVAPMGVAEDEGARPGDVTSAHARRMLRQRLEEHLHAWAPISLAREHAV